MRSRRRRILLGIIVVRPVGSAPRVVRFEPGTWRLWIERNGATGDVLNLLVSRIRGRGMRTSRSRGRPPSRLQLSMHGPSTTQRRRSAVLDDRPAAEAWPQRTACQMHRSWLTPASPGAITGPSLRTHRRQEARDLARSVPPRRDPTRRGHACRRVEASQPASGSPAGSARSASPARSP